LNKLGRITAEKTLQSKRQKPCFYLNVNVDVTELTALQEKLKVSVTDFIIKALAVGIVKWPIMTGRLEGEFIELADSIGIGLAIAVKNGLAAPIVKDADKKNLTEIAQDSTSITERTRAGKLSPDDLKGGCITVSNLGSLGIDSFIPIVVPGQCSILGVGKITDTCVSKGGEISVRKLMKMSLAVDHRIANGAEAAQFLSYVVDLLQEPGKLA
jgi:pyruvate dehydrogenase E2 component (dihydrolipoamide acetyltransferase)